MVSLFHSWYVMLGFVRNILCSEDLFWFQSYWGRDILHGNFRLLFWNTMVVIQTVFTNLTLLCHICWTVYSPTVTYDWFIWGKSWRVPHVGQEMLTLSGTPDFTPFGEFIYYMYTLYITECVVPGPDVSGDRLMALASLGSQRVRGTRVSSLLFWVWQDQTCFMIVTHNGNNYHVNRNIQGYWGHSSNFLAGEDCYYKRSYRLKWCCCWFSHRYKFVSFRTMFTD